MMEEIVLSDKSFWSRLERLRRVFLGREGGENAGGQSAYWQEEADLRAYDESFGRRIAAKWDFALEQLSPLAAGLPQLEWLDWGCGSAVASERLFKNLPELVAGVELYDHSAQALSFSEKKLLELGLQNVKRVEPKTIPEFATKGVLLSHVLNELSDGVRGRLLNSLLGADAILWVESGTHSTSRALSECRDILVKKGEFEVLFPCPAVSACGMLMKGNESHWCHFFANAPSEWHQSPAWAEFSQKMGIDLRSLPLSGIILLRRGLLRGHRSKDEASSVDWARVIGVPRVYKGYQKLLTCSASEGVSEKTFEQRVSKAVFKKLAKGVGRDNSLTRPWWKLSEDKAKIVDASIKS